MDAVSAKTASRDSCISCGATQLIELSGGRYRDEPLHSFIAGDHWGENPMPLIANERWSLVQCSACEQKFHRHILSPEWNEIRFSQWMTQDAMLDFELDQGMQNGAAAHVQHILRLRGLGVSRLLDFGCGFGRFLEMCSLFELDAVGVDRSSHRRDGAAIKIVPSLDDVDGQFDAITMFEVLEHLDDPLAVLGLLRARLVDGGILVVEVPDTTGVTSIRTRDEYYKIHPLDHINAFTPQTLVAMLRRAGFRPIAKSPAFVTASPLRVLKDVGKAMLKQNSTQRYFRAVS